MLRKGYVDTPDGQIHYREVGNGQPLILLHQNPSSSRMWEAVMPGLAADGRRVIAFDTPGYGESDPPPSKPSLNDYAAQFMRAADALGLETFDVGGHHTGALVSAIIAADYPGRVRKLITVGYPLLPDTMREGLANAKTAEYSDDGRELMGYWEGVKRLGGQWFNAEIGRRDYIAKLQAGPNWNWAYHAVSAADDRGIAQRITVPTLLIVGRGDPLSRFQDEAATVFPNATKVVIEDGGVNVPDDAPDAFVTEVNRFLNA